MFKEEKAKDGTLAAVVTLAPLNEAGILPGQGLATSGSDNNIESATVVTRRVFALNTKVSVVMLNQAKDSWSRAGAAVKLLISQSQDYKWRKLQRSKMAAVVNKVMAETSAEKQQVAEQQQAVDDSIDREMEHEEEQVAGGQSREDGTGMEGQLEDLTEQWHLDTFFDSTGDTDSAKN